MKAVQFTEYGDPSKVLTVADVAEPAPPGSGEVLVAVQYSPVNQHDLGLIGGHLVRGPLPATPGNEGVARVLRVGPDVSGVRPGDQVVLPLLSGSWRERLVVPAAGLAPLPDGDVRQFAMLGSNPPTAGLILDEFATLSPGDWVIQNAGNGGVGRSLIALARERGLRTVSIVRRAEVVDELKKAGADVVVVAGPNVVAEIRAHLNDAPLLLGADAIGGAAARTLLQLLSPGGTLVSYNNSSGEGIDPADPEITAKGLKAAGIFVGAFDRATKLVPLVAEATPLVADGRLSVPIEAVYELDDVLKAVTHAERGGKILLHIGD